MLHKRDWIWKNGSIVLCISLTAVHIPDYICARHQAKRKRTTKCTIPFALRFSKWGASPWKAVTLLWDSSLSSHHDLKSHHHHLTGTRKFWLANQKVTEKRTLKKFQCANIFLKTYSGFMSQVQNASHSWTIFTGGGVTGCSNSFASHFEVIHL